MKIPLQITFRGMHSSDAAELAIRDKAQRLEHFCPRITGCHVIVDAPHHHRRKGEVFRVTVDLTVPGREIVASREAARDSAHDDLYVAVRDAFAAATRQLEDYARTRRGDL